MLSKQPKQGREHGQSYQAAQVPGEDHRRGPSQEGQSTVPRLPHLHLRRLTSGGGRTTPGIPGGDVGALQPRLQTFIAIPCQACHRDEGWR